MALYVTPNLNPTRSVRKGDVVYYPLPKKKGFIDILLDLSLEGPTVELYLLYQKQRN